MTSHLRTVVTSRESTPEERRAASRLVLRRARSREDLHELLDALGLNAPNGRRP